MNSREFLENALDKDPEDDGVRRALADLLDDFGEHEEAERHRKYPEARAFLAKFIAEHMMGGVPWLSESSDATKEFWRQWETYTGEKRPAEWRDLEIYGDRSDYYDGCSPGCG